jgi:D-alanyl-lipoteichoic acid acyltransferase DltB (MBOAT superfamily)
MLFNSAEFLFYFLPLVICCYYFLLRYRRADLTLGLLLLSSLFFYGFWSPKFLVLLILSIIGNFCFGLAISRIDGGFSKKTLLFLSVSSNLILIAYFKYLGFFVEVLNSLAVSILPVPEIVLPLAISFFTFQQIAYLVDVYEGQKAEIKFVRYALFVSFFPQLIAGPIVHHYQILPQYSHLHGSREQMRLFNQGITLFALGLSKKILLADTAARYASPIFDGVAGGSAVSFFEAWVGMISYSFQIYFDFSGYSDMAIGLGLMFGFKLPINFLSPYRASSIIDFWKRWHITLSQFLRDYLYIPLGGSRNGDIRKYYNILITMILGGLWHGAGNTFLLWGGLHGMFIIINHLWRRSFSEVEFLKGKLAKAFMVAFTFLLVSIAWVFFRAESVADALTITSSLFGLGGVGLPLIIKPFLGDFSSTLEMWGFSFIGIGPNGLIRTPVSLVFVTGIMAIIIWWTPPAICIALGDDSYYRKSSIFRECMTKSYIRWSPSLIWSLVTGTLLGLCFLSLSKVSEFIYFNF